MKKTHTSLNPSQSDGKTTTYENNKNKNEHSNASGASAKDSSKSRNAIGSIQDNKNAEILSSLPLDWIKSSHKEGPLCQCYICF